MAHLKPGGLWGELEGHQLTLKPLVQAANENRLAGTMLFAGPSGIGKKRSALTLAQSLVCDTPVGERAEGAGCGVCGACIRVAGGQSESLMVVEPDGAQIKIEQARDILQFLQLQKLGRARVIIIDQAHLLGPQAGNALLKALEEPPAGTHFVLVSHLPNSILATLRSRSQLIRFRPLSDESLAKILSREPDALPALPPKKAAKGKSGGETDAPPPPKPKAVLPKIDDWLLRSAHGSVEAAKRLLDDRAEFEELELATQGFMAASLGGFPGPEIATLRELLKDRTTHGFVASTIQGVVTEAMKIKSGLKPNAKLKGTERLNQLIGPLSEKSSRTLDTLAQKSLDFEADLARNVDRGLLLESLAIALNRA